MGRGGVEPPIHELSVRCQSEDKACLKQAFTNSQNPGFATGLAISLQQDPHLTYLIDRWPGLPQETRKAILACAFPIKPNPRRCHALVAAHPIPRPPDKGADPEFLVHELRRGPIHLREYSRSFDIQDPACLLLRLRALVGIQARAEILCLLASVKEIHPSEAARKTAYYQKTVQTALVGMSQSGVVLSRTTKQAKYYRLKPDILDALLMPNGQGVRWINWPALLIAVETIWRRLGIVSKQRLEPLLLCSELKKLLLSIRDPCSQANLNEITFDQHVPVDDFPEHFQKILDVLARQLAP